MTMDKKKRDDDEEKEEGARPTCLHLTHQPG